MAVMTDSDSFVYCAAFLNGAVPVSTDDVTRPLAFVRAFNGSTTMSLGSLVPSTSYVVYCMAVSVASASHVELAVVLDSGLTLTTLCCKTLTATLVAQSLREGTSQLAGLSVVLSHAPSDSLTLSFGTTDLESTALVTFHPSVVAVWSNSPSRVFSTDIVALSCGNVTVNVAAAGASYPEYDVVYNTPQNLLIQSAQEPPPVPEVVSVAFSNDADSIVVAFNANTDRGRLGGRFSCKLLLVFAQAAALRCQWMDARRLVIYPSVDVQVGEVVVVAADTIRAECVVSHTHCSDWTTVVPNTAVGAIVASLTPVTPVVALSYAAVLGTCDSLLLDMTASTGAGGRPWLPPQITVETAPAGVDTTELVTFLNSSYTFSPPPAISANLLLGGVRYTVGVRLCNFLGGCGVGSAFIQVVATSSVPVVAVQGSATRAVDTTQAVSVAVTAYTANCNGTISSANLTYRWRVFQYGEYEMDSLVSQSVDPKKFQLPAYSLEPGTWYSVRAQVIHTVSGASSEAFANTVLSVARGRLVAKLVGGVERNIRLGERLELDGSQSYDEEVQGLTGSALDTVSFAWSCVQMLPEYATTCPFAVGGKSDDGSVGVADASGLHLELGVKVRVTLTITDGEREGIALVELVAIDALAPAVLVLQAPPSTDPANVLRLGASVSSVDACVSRWNMSDGTMLTEIALSPTTIMIPAGVEQYPLYLALRPDSLVGYATYRFVLECGRASASIDVTTNGPPQYGTFVVAPSVGVELDTTFNMHTESWYDSNLLLTYQFGYFSTTGLRIVLQSRSERSFVSTLLPRGAANAAFNVTCRVLVFDALDASALHTALTTVTAAPLMEVASFPNQINSALVSVDGDVDRTRQVITLYTAVLNAANCSSTPNCTVLNRLGCNTKSHTCGACMDGFVGNEGPENTACLDAAELAVVASPASGVVLRNKTCPTGRGGDGSRQCSGRGNCSFVDSRSLVNVATCSVHDITCSAQCICQTGYGGDACTLQTSDLAAAVHARSLLISNLQLLTTQEDPSNETVLSWLAGAIIISQNQEELSADSADTVLDIAAVAMAAATNIGSDPSVVAEVVGAVNIASSVIGKSVSGPGAAAAQARHGTEALTKSRSVLDAMGALMMKTQVPDEEPFVRTLSTTKMYSQVIATGESVQVSVPQSSLEVAYKVPPTAVTVNHVAEMFQVGVTIVESKPFQFGNGSTSFTANPLNVQIQADDANVSVIIIYQNLYPMGYAVYNDTGAHNNVTTHCVDGVANSTTLICPGNVEILHTCNGTAGVLVTPCPSRVDSPACRILATNNGESACTIVNYTATSTTCSCVLVDTVRRRRLGSADSVQSFQAVTITESLVSDFTTTLSSVPTSERAIIQTLRGSVMVILMFGALWFVGLSLIGYFIVTDRGARSSVIPVQGDEGGERIGIENPVSDSSATAMRACIVELLGYIDMLFPAVRTTAQSILLCVQSVCSEFCLFLFDL